MLQRSRGYREPQDKEKGNVERKGGFWAGSMSVSRTYVLFSLLGWIVEGVVESHRERQQTGLTDRENPMVYPRIQDHLSLQTWPLHSS